jgi:NADH dehydrogenase (ubiquinone) 1 alpha subcomplex subunit 6
MASRRILQSFQQGNVKPVLSSSKTEARRRVMALYRAWYRQIPYILHVEPFDVTEKQCKDKLREIFYQNGHIQDTRVIDMMVIKGQMELTETVRKFKQEGHFLKYFNETTTPRPKDFISRFLQGKDSE